MVLGLGTFSVGIIEKNSFFILLGIFNLLVFIFYFVLNFVIVQDFSNNRLLFVYSIVFVAIGYVCSLYSGIFHPIFSYHRNNPNSPDVLQFLQIEKKIICLIYNIFILGSGIFLYGLSKICKRDSCCSNWWRKYRHILYGLIQICGFILFLISLYFEDGRKIAFLVIGIISYCFSLFSEISINIPGYDELLFS